MEEKISLRKETREEELSELLKKKNKQINSLKEEVYLLKQIKKQFQEKLKSFWDSASFFSKEKPTSSSKEPLKSLIDKLSSEFTEEELGNVLTSTIDNVKKNLQNPKNTEEK